MPEPASYGRLRIRTGYDADALVLALHGDLDLASAPQFESALIEAESASPAVVVDLSGLDFMDSSGLQTLLRATRRCRKNGHQFSLIRGPLRVQRVFELTRTTRFFSFDEHEVLNGQSVRQ